MHPTVLSIAGYDPSAAAGAAADLKTFAAFDMVGAAVITAVTVQNSVGVQSLHVLPEDLVGQQIEAILGDFDVRAVKIGALGSLRIARLLADLLERDPLPNVVLDPVLQASGGVALLERRALPVVRDRLLPKARVLTPNLEEAAALAGMAEVRDLQGMKEAARRLQGLGARAVVVKGGHLPSRAVDVLYDGRRFHLYDATRLGAAESRGLGCAFSSAIAAQLARGVGLEAAVDAAKQYVSRALLRAVRVGRGRLHLDHLGAVPRA